MSAVKEFIRATWTKVGEDWAVRVPSNSGVESGDTIIAVNRAGVEKSVTVHAPAGEDVWTLAPRKSFIPVEAGYYLRDDRVFKVRVSRAGNPYATMMVAEGNRGRWEYQQGAMRSLTTSHAITMEQAAEYGHLHTASARSAGGRSQTPQA